MSAPPDRSRKSAEKVLNAIRRALPLFPDMRVGQLIDNALPPGGADVFYVENDKLAEDIDAFAARALPPEPEKEKR